MMYTLAQALEMRGFLVKDEGDYISFSKGNARGEKQQLQQVLQDLEIPVRWEENRLFMESPEVDIEKLHKIIWFPARNHEASGGNGWYGWKYFSRRKHGPKINTFVLETGVALLTKALSAAGIITISSCDGHGRKAPLIAFSGKHNGAWFQLLFQKQFRDVSFHYDWYLKNTDRDTVDLTVRIKNESWYLEKVLEDTWTMARYFLENATVLSETKRALFRSNYKTRRKIVREMKFEELLQWMEERYVFLHESPEKHFNVRDAKMENR